MNDKLKILLCEDDENLGMLLREFLQAKGFNADLCPDGDKGYKAFLKGKYDLCVLDVMMPVKDGFTLAQEIRNVNSEVPIIFLTAKSLKDDVLEGCKGKERQGDHSLQDRQVHLRHPETGTYSRRQDTETDHQGIRASGSIVLACK